MSAQAAVAVLFLDIDGVLNRTHGATHIRLDDDCVARLRTIVQRSRCSIVLSTFWRGFEAYVKYILHRQGIDSSLVIGRTPGTTDGDRFDAESSAFDAQQYANRAAEIRSWLQANPSVTRFVILDDRPSASDEGLAAHFVQTQSDRGLTDADVQAALAILAEVTWTAEDEEPAPDESDVQVSRELLSRHTCLASFAGLEPGREPMLRIFPPQPAKTWARFDVESYEEYEKPGKYGDEQQASFAFVPAECEDAAVVSALGALQPGARVRLSWRHEYVTRSAWSAPLQQRTSSSFPERPVVLLEPLPASEVGAAPAGL